MAGGSADSFASTIFWISFGVGSRLIFLSDDDEDEGDLRLLTVRGVANCGESTVGEGVHFRTISLSSFFVRMPLRCKSIKSEIVTGPRMEPNVSGLTGTCAIFLSVFVGVFGVMLSIMKIGM